MTLVGCGGIVAELLAASIALSREGIECRVISHHTISQVDHEAIASAAAGTGGIVTVEEHTVTGGLGGAIAEWCLENGVLPRRFRRIGLRDEFATVVGSQDYLRERYAMGADAIAKTVRAMLGAER